MGKHVPLPSDPVAKAAEKRRRFKAYQRVWKTERAHRRNTELAGRWRERRRLEQSALALNIDLCVELEHATVEQLRKNIGTAEGWIAELR